MCCGRPGTVAAMFIRLLLGVLLLAGCTANSAPQPAGLAKTEEIGQAALGFAKCMREHGYQVPDPSFDDQGLPVYGDLRGGVVTEKNAEFDQIRRDCAAPLDTAYRNAGVRNAKEVKPEELLGFARCMREHGIDIPDPTAEDLMAIPKNAFTSPDWEPAKLACESLLPASWRWVLDPPRPGGGGK